MRFEVFNSFSQKINALSKESYCSIAQVAEKASNLSRYMAMINTKLTALEGSVRNRLVQANQALVVLISNHLFILLGGYPIPALNAGVPLVLNEFCLLKRIFPGNLKACMRACLASIHPTASHFRILMESRQGLIDLTFNTFFEFVFHI